MAMASEEAEGWPELQAWALIVDVRARFTLTARERARIRSAHAHCNGHRPVPPSTGATRSHVSAQLRPRGERRGGSGVPGARLSSSPQRAAGG